MRKDCEWVYKALKDTRNERSDTSKNLVVFADDNVNVGCRQTYLRPLSPYIDLNERSDSKEALLRLFSLGMPNGVPLSITPIAVIHSGWQCLLEDSVMYATGGGKVLLGLVFGVYFPPSERFILLLKFDEDVQCNYQRPYIRAISSRIKLLQASDEVAALILLSSPHLSGVFVADGSISDPQRATLLEKLVQYTRDGGIVVLGDSFSKSIPFSNFNSFFESTWNLSWRCGNHIYATFQRNDSNDLARMNPQMPLAYKVEALNLTGMSPEDAVYKLTEKFMTENQAFGKKLIDDSTQSPAVFARVGRGSLGYIGDSNWEENSTQLILSMFDLLPQADARSYFQAHRLAVSGLLIMLWIVIMYCSVSNART